jgi:predicted nucleotidyltransferase component of viral defense system
VTPVYLETARLMTRVAPWVFAGGAFALKGGTAINLFVRDLPRLSVDLDLVLIDHRLDRSAALATIDAALRDAAQRLAQRGFDVHTARTDGADGTKLFVRQRRVEVKVEVNGVLRGTVHPVRVMSLTARSRDILAADLALPVVSSADLYGGKLVAALDRQHPRDLFDVMELYRDEGLTPEIRRGFVVYLASHNRPMHEVLAPTPRDIDLRYRSSFSGMTAEPVGLEDLLATRERLIADVRIGLDADERAFLLSIAQCAPDWSRLDIEHLHELPALRWKLENLRRLAHTNPVKFRDQSDRLEQLLGSG